MTYDPCRPLHLAVNHAGAPADAQALVEEAVAEVSRATGPQIVVDPPTGEQANVSRSMSKTLAGYAPVLIAWAGVSRSPT